MTADEQTQMRQWLENWRIAGPLLEAERASRVAALTDDQAVPMALDLWRLAIPGRGDDAEGLVLLKRLLAGVHRP